MFFGSFGNKSDVCKQFEISDFDGTVIFAVYDMYGYEGEAEVIFVNDGNFYMVHGSHCSCYGLEDQWEPIEMPINGLRRIIEGSRLLSEYGTGLSEALEVIDGLNLEEASEDTVRMALKLAYG